MLNISENSINHIIDIRDYRAFKLLRQFRNRRLILYITIGLLLTALLSLFLPWTQNIRARGYVTTRLPEQRPQGIQSVISGKLESWFVREGDFVNAGDTIVFISEVKSEYFDPELVDRTSEQVSAKSQSIQSYGDKLIALQRQYLALAEGRQLKIDQTQNKIQQALNKIQIDSIDLVAYQNNTKIALNQLQRIEELHDKGLKSLSELQEKQLKVQEMRAKVNAQQNKLLNQRTELNYLFIELSSIEQDYADKLAKSQSEQQSALADKLEATAQTAKLQNQLSNYNVRQDFYYITAPQSGYITKTIQKGLGEIIKEGTDIVTIAPVPTELVIEVYVLPQDLPLLSLGNTTRMRFDGWPAIVISGWPEASTGIFSGTISAIDRFIGDNGYYRILISPDESEKAWPKDLRVGTGAQNFILLKDVPVWYEIWRQLNGFPADLYTPGEVEKKDIKLKAPLKSVK